MLCFSASVQTYWGREIYIEETMPQLIYYSNEGCVAKSHFPLTLQDLE